MSTTELHERVERLEAEVTELRDFMMKPQVKPHRNAWLNTVGIFKDDPDFQEIVRLGREYRESQPYPFPESE